MKDGGGNLKLFFFIILDIIIIIKKMNDNLSNKDEVVLTYGYVFTYEPMGFSNIDCKKFDDYLNYFFIHWMQKQFIN